MMVDVISSYELQREREVEALRKDAERYRKLCEVPGAMDAFTAAYYNTQTKEQLDAVVDAVPAVR